MKRQRSTEISQLQKVRRYGASTAYTPIYATWDAAIVKAGRDRA